MERNCFRCDTELDDPVEENAKYIRGPDTVETVEKEIAVEHRHTFYTRAVRDRLMQEKNMNLQQATSAIARESGRALESGMSHDLSKYDFDTRETIDPSFPKEDAEVIRVDSTTKEVEEERTGLICQGCLKDDDEIIW
jgi:hypothetical protein